MVPNSPSIQLVLVMLNVSALPPRNHQKDRLRSSATRIKDNPSRMVSEPNAKVSGTVNQNTAIALVAASKLKHMASNVGQPLSLNKTNRTPSQEPASTAITNLTACTPSIFAIFRKAYTGGYAAKGKRGCTAVRR